VTVKVKHILLTPSKGDLLLGVTYQDTRIRISFRDGSSTLGLFCYSKQSPLSSEALLERRRVKVSDEDYGKSTDYPKWDLTYSILQHALCCKFEDDYHPIWC